jgi:hypothetical protein
MTRRASSILLVLSLVAVVAFMFWLSRKANSLDTGVAPVLEEETTEALEFGLDEIAADASAVVGQSGWIRAATVAQRLGRAAFAIQLDEATTYPVLLSRDLIQRGTEVYGQDMVTLFGHVYTFNDSIGGEWVSQDAVDAENADAIPSSPSFLMADSLSFN